MPTFKPDSAGFRAMAVGTEIRAAVTAEAERAKRMAESLAEEFRVTGEYAESFEVSTTTTTLRTAAGTHDVATGMLTNQSDHAAAVEWGNARDKKPHRVLGKVLGGLAVE